MKVEIEMPDGSFCTGCPCLILLPGHWVKANSMWAYGCALLRDMCHADGEYETRARKRHKCPSLGLQKEEEIK